MTLIVTQICLNELPDGALRYMSIASNALSDLQIEHTNILSPKTIKWFTTNKEANNTSLSIDSTLEQLYNKLPQEPSCLFIHGNIASNIITSIREMHFLVIFAHNPAIDNIPYAYHAANMIITVSEYVSRTLKSHGFKNVAHPPLYGISPVNSAKERDSIGKPISGPVINWNMNKIRDVFLSYLDNHNIYCSVNKNNLPADIDDCKINLGIVSRLARLKRFPELLTQLSPILSKYPSICLHIFGSGSYREVKNIEKSTILFKDRTFYWGWQENPYVAYKYIDYLLLGRPEYEALGLNVLEAQTIGLKAIAINDGPFPETIVNNKNGWLYNDPKTDHAESFNSLIKLILENRNNNNHQKIYSTKNNFTYKSFVSTLNTISNTIATNFSIWKHSRK